MFVNYQQIELIGSHVAPLRFTKAVLTDKIKYYGIHSLHIIPQYFYLYLDTTIYQYIAHPYVKEGPVSLSITVPAASG